ncbi:DNA-binding PadR family transcriptional regulator [Actinoalloteichus hoggarensis]|uniref:Transcriptional regulator PadR-like family protein n=1 Tax=Actinoalloteichus hoggarensis TaxID=1470176 RepID=A0A221W7T8_9PSEU|nr:PadR family transcriptional regulator [Actinoalloteichus hoggarensis]ASO22060.1 Transcriptional regulator PadR-like family protein [Actinoalloteichus hoggarensis]MBB5923858.1 DNA-binding PadR family transcriptional regulator [Actinoalloteichus hoggarensis]
MAHVILGLLLIRSQSLYDLIKAFEAGVGLLYSASSGSIKRALDQLRERGLIAVAGAEPTGRGRKAYHVTDAGRREFHTWMTSEPTGSDLEGAALNRLYFLGLVDPAERRAILRRIEARISEERARFTDLGDRIAAAAVPEDLREIAVYQRATLDYGLASLGFLAEWFRERAEREDQRPAADGGRAAFHGRGPASSRP